MEVVWVGKGEKAGLIVKKTELINKKRKRRKRAEPDQKRTGERKRMRKKVWGFEDLDQAEQNVPYGTRMKLVAQKLRENQEKEG